MAEGKEVKKGVIDTPEGMTDEEYKKIIAETADLVIASTTEMRKAEGSVIRTYYRIGSIVSSLQQSSGEGIVKSFTDRLRQDIHKRDEDINVEASTLYACGTLFNALTEEQLESLINVGMGWKYIRSLTSGNYDSSIRNEAINLLVDGKVAPKQTPRVLETLAGGGDVQDIVDHNERENKPNEERELVEIAQSAIFNFKETVELNNKRVLKSADSVHKHFAGLSEPDKEQVSGLCEKLVATLNEAIVVYKQVLQRFDDW